MNFGKQSVRSACTTTVAIAISLALAPSATAIPPNSGAQGITTNIITPDCVNNGRQCARCFATGPGTRFDGPQLTPAYSKARAFLGSTPQEVQQNFAAIIERHLSRPNAEKIFSHLSDKELSDLATLYKNSAPAGDTDLYRALAKKLDAKQLVRAAVAFGAAPIASAVDATPRPT